MVEISTEMLKTILSDYNPGYTSEDLLTLYMICGGVAKYVELLLDANATTHDKMIDAVCKTGYYCRSQTQSGENQSTDFSG